ncbi:unnamed protein product [Mytilus edulis]|uniref:DZIP3-like HEPN domain-containing protein n=1 Tax=Mytilus edulis TaxID=6550 RepID=A0A8S3Q2X1_MYTED|nr:unnamed protein product [Mytilus edulis]
MASLSIEGENYVRMGLLLTGISPRAIRALFDQEFHPSCLDASIKKEYNKLLEMKKNKIINQPQWNLLFPRFPDVPTSSTFDVTLMITLLRNLTDVNSPHGGFDKLPTSIETTTGSDFARIKYYRNYLAHLEDAKIENDDFISAWDDISQAIGRLGGESLKQECDQLKTKILDQTNKEIILEIKNSKSEIEELKQLVKDHDSDTSCRQHLLQYLKQLELSEQVALINTKDTMIKYDIHQTGDYPLIRACKLGYTDMVQWMLHNDVDVDQCRDDGVTGLFMACKEGYTTILNLLLEKKPNVNLCDNKGWNPLYMAKKNPNVNLCDNNGRSPLNMAIETGYTDIVKLLLEKNPNVNLCDNNGYSPLNLASLNGYHKLGRNTLDHQPFAYLCSDGFFTSNDQIDIVQLILLHKADINAQTFDGGNALLFSTLTGNLELTQLLLENNADCNICIYNKILLDQNANVDICDNDGLTPLMKSCFNNHTSTVQLLVKYKPDINARTVDGNNALVFSALNGNLEITKVLLENNADYNNCIQSKQLIIESLSGHVKTKVHQKN